jgi:hypothetical protein
MVVLGAKVAVSWLLRNVRTCVEERKARIWARQLQQLTDEDFCEAGDASKWAGRLSFSVTAAADRVGRAFIGAWHAQAHCPLRGGRLSWRLYCSALWFVAYLRLGLTAARAVGDEVRPRVLTWTDAAGASRWLAALVLVEGRFFWTRLLTPPEVWAQLLERGDNQIGVQEALAVILCLATFHEHLVGVRWYGFIDNSGVMHNFLKGSSKSPETNEMIGQFWLQLARNGTSFRAGQVESAANPADGPTRENLLLMQALGARYVEPVLPAWKSKLWAGAVFLGDGCQVVI